MLIELKRRDLIGLYSVINSLDSKKNYNKWFIYAMTRNGELISPEVKAISKIKEPSEEYSEFEEKRALLIDEHAERDEHDRVVMFEDNVKIKKEDIDIFKEKLNSLESEYADVIEKRNKDFNDMVEILDNNIELDLELIDFKHLPDELTPDEMRALTHIIKDR